jgi:hypothetical protein
VRDRRVAVSTRWLPQATNEPVLPNAETTHWLPVAGSPGSLGGRGEGGDAPNKVAEKTAFDKFAEEMAYAGAIANGQMNEDTKSPDGKQ